MRIGFIGLGNAGMPIAKNIIRAGYGVSVYDIDNNKTSEMINFGAKKGLNPSDVAKHTEVVFTSLPHPSVSENVILGENGIIAGAQKGNIVIELSTISPKLVLKLSNELLKKGIEFVDAGVAGGIESAVKGSLIIMAGGKKEVIEKIKPILDSIAEKVFHVGPVGTGMILKVINNQISHVNMVAICEGVAVGIKAGISPETIYEVISVSSGNSYQFQKRYGYRILNRKFDGGMKLGLAYKDSELACDLGREMGMPLYVTNVAHAVYEHAKAKGLSERDYSSIIMLWEELLGKEIKKSS